MSCHLGVPSLAAAVLALSSFGSAHAACGETGLDWTGCAWVKATPQVFSDAHVSAGVESTLFGNASSGPLSLAADPSAAASATVRTTLQGEGRFGIPAPVDVFLDATAVDVGRDDMLHLYATASGVGTVRYAPNQPVNIIATWDALYINQTAETVSLSFLAAGRMTRDVFSADPAANRNSILTVGDRSFVDRVADSRPDYFAHLNVATLDPGQSIRVSLSVQFTTDFSEEQYYTGPNRVNAGNAFGATLLSYMATPVSAVPEPGTLAMFAIGMAGLGIVRRRRTR